MTMDKDMENMMGDDDLKGEEVPCMNVIEVTKNLAKTQYVNIIGGSTTKGSPIKGGQSGEA
jgi:hypothetical protein